MSRIRHTLRRIPFIVIAYGAVRGWLAALAAWPRFIGQWITFRRRADNRFSMALAHAYPCLSDATEHTGFDRHYTFHTAWAARVLAETRPAEHVDIASAVYFAGIVSAFVPTRFYDVRPARMDLANLKTGAADLTQLPFANDSLPSLSCMHVVEHVGLGRYGDRLDPEGDLKAIAELKRVVKPGGDLLFVVPIGEAARIQFNAHRIYTVPMIQSLFNDRFTTQAWALIPEDPADGDLVANAPAEMLNRQFYGCGCFWFRKK